MPVLSAPVVHTVHGSTFTSWVGPSRGSAQLCAWQLTVPANLAGAPHRPSHDEVLLVLTGSLTVHLDGEAIAAGPGAVVLVPAGAEFCVDGGPDGATAWVTTTPGLTATMPDGSTIAPPWAN
jgi:quercetin dioxygenase-like cupin family protein